MCGEAGSGVQARGQDRWLLSLCFGVTWSLRLRFVGDGNNNEIQPHDDRVRSLGSTAVAYYRLCTILYWVPRARPSG